MGLLNTGAAGAGSAAAPAPPPPASDKYSAAHMEACLKHQFGAPAAREGRVTGMEGGREGDRQRANENTDTYA